MTEQKPSLQQLADQFDTVLGPTHGLQPLPIVLQWLRASVHYDPKFWPIRPASGDPLLLTLYKKDVLDVVLPTILPEVSGQILADMVNARAADGSMSLAAMLKNWRDAPEVDAHVSLPIVIAAATVENLKSLDDPKEDLPPGSGLIQAVLAALNFKGYSAAEWTAQEIQALAQALQEALHRLGQDKPAPKLWASVKARPAVDLMRKMGASLIDPVPVTPQSLPAWRVLLTNASASASGFFELTGVPLDEIDPAASAQIKRINEIRVVNSRETTGYVRRVVESAAQTLEGTSRVLIAWRTRPELMGKTVSAFIASKTKPQIAQLLAPDQNGLTPLAYMMSEGSNEEFAAVLALAQHAQVPTEISNTGQSWFQLKAERRAPLASMSGLRPTDQEPYQILRAEHTLHRAELLSSDPIGLLFGPTERQQPLIMLIDSLFADIIADQDAAPSVPLPRHLTAVEMVYLLPAMSVQQLQLLDPALLGRLRLAATLLFSPPDKVTYGRPTSKSPLVDQLVDRAGGRIISVKYMTSEKTAEHAAKYFNDPPRQWTPDMLRLWADDDGKAFKRLLAQDALAAWQAVVDHEALSIQSPQNDAPLSSKARQTL